MVNKTAAMTMMVMMTTLKLEFWRCQEKNTWPTLLKYLFMRCFCRAQPFQNTCRARQPHDSANHMETPVDLYCLMTQQIM